MKPIIAICSMLLLTLVVEATESHAFDRCEMNFERFLTADRVEVTGPRNELLREIVSPEEIEAIARYAIAHTKNWEAPWYGVPIGKIHAEFFVGKKFIGDFGYGDTFFTAQGCGYFYSHGVKVDERENLARLFGVPDPYKNMNKNKCGFWSCN